MGKTKKKTIQSKLQKNPLSPKTGRLYRNSTQIERDDALIRYWLIQGYGATEIIELFADLNLGYRLEAETIHKAVAKQKKIRLDDLDYKIIEDFQTLDLLQKDMVRKYELSKVELNRQGKPSGKTKSPNLDYIDKVTKLLVAKMRLIETTTKTNSLHKEKEEDELLQFNSADLLQTIPQFLDTLSDDQIIEMVLLYIRQKNINPSTLLPDKK